MAKFHVGAHVRVLVSDTDAYTEGEIGTVIEVDPPTEPYDYLVQLPDEEFAFRREYYFYERELGRPKDG